MALAAITAKLKARLNRSMPAARDAELGNRLGELEGLGLLTHNYGGAHADKTFAITDLPIASLIRIVLTNADGAANLILPATANKMFIIVNTSGQAVTVKVTGQTGFAVASTKTAIAVSNGTDITRVTGDA